MTNLQDKYGNWLFVTPINNLILSKEIGEEIKINRVIFVSREKLPRIRRRLKIPVTLSALVKEKGRKLKEITTNFFKDSETYAVIPFKGKPSEKESDCIRLIEEELNILSLSQLGWLTRKFNRQIRIKTLDNVGSYSKININKEKQEFNIGFSKTTSPVPFRMDKNWTSFHKKFYFFRLLNIIQDKSKVTSKWRKTIHRASILAGQSQNSNDLTSCLLWNIIVLEMLLTESDDKIMDALVSRCEFFLGWNEEWVKKDFENKIREVYRRRSKFGHEGDIRGIVIDDILFTDDLIDNCDFSLYSNLGNPFLSVDSALHLAYYSDLVIHQTIKPVNITKAAQTALSISVNFHFFRNLIFSSFVFSFSYLLNSSSIPLIVSKESIKNPIKYQTFSTRIFNRPSLLSRSILNCDNEF